MVENIEIQRDVTSSFGESIKIWLKQAFKTDNDSVFITPQNETDEKMIDKIRKMNLIEFFGSLLGVFVLMWTLWWQGVQQDNNQMQTIAFVLIGLIGVYGLLISPFVHYRIEKGYTYRPGYLGLNYEQNAWTAWFEERGFGSLKRHWDVTLKDEKLRKIVNLVTLWVMITLVMFFLDDRGTYFSLVEAIIPEEEGVLQGYAAITGIMWTYQALATLVFGYSVYHAGKWIDTGKNDKAKKVLLIIPAGIAAFLGILFAWGFGIDHQGDGSWQIANFEGTLWTDIATMAQTTVESNEGALFLVANAAIWVFFWFLLKYVLLGILIRFDNLKTASFQFIFVSVIGVIVIFIVWAILTLPGLQDYILSHNTDFMSSVPNNEKLWYIFDNTATAAMNEFNTADYLANWGQYIYWGLVQEWLFLGYWCTLLTKAVKNKHFVALLSSACFGLIHFPSWPLMVFTMVGGYFWAIAWQRNDSRNLYVMGAIHGFSATWVAKLIPITMSVGPSNIRM